MGAQRKIETRGKFMWWQWLPGIGVMLVMFQGGSIGGWTSPYVAKLTSYDSPIPMTKDEAAMLVTLFTFGRLIGAFIGSISVHLFGSKKTQSIIGLPLVCCWAFILIADRPVLLYIGRFAGGFAIGMVYSSFSIYLGEVADPKVRGSLLTLAVLGTSTGNALIMCLGVSQSKETTAIVNLAFCMLFLIIFIYVPESPHHLLRQNNIERARKSLAWYRRDCEDLDMEFNTLNKFISIGNTSFWQKFKEFKHPPILHATILVVILLMYAQMSGINTIVALSEPVFINAKINIIAPSKAAMLMSLFGIIGSIISILIVDRLGRKFLMCFSCSIGSLALASLGIHFNLINLGYDPGNFQWLALISMVIFMTAIFVGILPIPSTVMGEILPPTIKYVATCFGSISAGLFAFVSASTYQPLLNVLSQHHVVWIYSIFLLTAVPFNLIFLPETKGKTLQDIQNKLARPR